MGSNQEELFPELVEAPPQPQLELEDENFEDEIVEDDEPLVPEITTREKIKQDDMFVNEIKKETKNVKVKIEDKPKVNVVKPVVVEDKPLETPQVKPVKPVKKKRVMSEAQKQKLAEARKKALEVRKAKAQQRKAEKDLIQQEKELTKKVRQKKVEKMKDEIANGVVDNVVETKQVSNTTMFTKEDLDKAVLNGIAGYEKIRKAQKKEKKEAQAEEERKKKIFNTISKAVDPELDMWGHCFSR
tara:strand:+ start:140 stop:868 length:729 start_codon:yes stop_codon:yes gene_type:complete